MWVEELSLENIKCFESTRIRFGTSKEKYKWVTLLGENGGGKSTILQALGLLLAGPEGADQLMKRPEGWLRSEKKHGLIGTRIHRGENDPGENFGVEKIRQAFKYSYWVSGREPIQINKKHYSEPLFIPTTDKNLTWLRQNALLPRGKGWFAAGYGALRRLTRENKILIPTLNEPVRYQNFQSQFIENEPLLGFEQWMVYQEFRIAKNGTGGEKARIHQKMGVDAMNRLLPEDARFDHVDEEGKVWFMVNEIPVATLSLSDGYRSILAFAGDLITRMIENFPDSEDPLSEEGVVLVDELDIHLHPKWQREIPGLLRTVFPNIQFIVATHSPLIAAGAGEDAVTYRIRMEGGDINIAEVDNLAFKSVDRILQSEAFGLVSTYSPEAEQKLQQYLKLKLKPKRTPKEEDDFQQLSMFAKEIYANSLNLSDEDLELREKMKNFIKSKESK